MAVTACCKLAALMLLLAAAPALAQVEATDSDTGTPAVPTAPAPDEATGAANDAGQIVLELNGATDTESGACRMTFVASNQSGQAFESTAWQVGVFDADGIVRSILVLEFGALTDGKTKIVLFDLPGSGCADISRVVVNDVAQCQPEGAAGTELADTCLDALVTRSRTDIDLGL